MPTSVGSGRLRRIGNGRGPPLAPGPKVGPEAAIPAGAGGHLDRLTTRIRPTRTWADLELPPRKTGLVRELLARYRHRHTVYGDWSFRTASGGVVTVPISDRCSAN